MTHRPLVVGNDVVDLTADRTRGKARNQRFLQRILDPVERAYVANSAEADLALWRLWAAKEAAYKIASKLLPEPPVFEHAAFGVRWSADDAAAKGVRTGTVRWQDVEVVVVVTHDGDHVHAVGHAGEPGGLAHAEERSLATIGVGLGRLDDPHALWAGSEDALRRRFTPREADAVHSLASAAVRLAARDALAGALGVVEARLEIVCAPGDKGRRPPWVFLDGAPAAADVSLSHDGPWLGWAWSVADDPEPAYRQKGL